MATYQVRPATLDDVDSLVDQRVGMFTDMGQMTHPEATAAAFREWLADTMPAGVYRAWVVEAGDEPRGQDAPSGATERPRPRCPAVVAGGGITILPWPPGPQSLTGRIAFVYNVYTAPAHRNRGIGRLLMGAIHTWCREHGIDCLRLNASAAGEHLYTSIGYREVASPTLEIMLKPRHARAGLAKRRGFR